MQTGDFDFDDYLLQVQSVKKMGGMQSMIKMIPGEAELCILDCIVVMN